MKIKKLRLVWTGVSCLLAVLFAVYVLMDTFLISQSYQTAAEPNLAGFSSEAGQNLLSQSALSAQGGEEENSAQAQQLPTDDENLVYSDENIAVALRTYREYDTDIYVAEVWLSSAQYLKTAFADNSYGKNVTAKTSEIASQSGAILAINGDYYGARESGYVIRNGVVYRDYGSSGTDILCVYADGSFAITNSGESSAQELVDSGVWQAFSFGPGLVENGAISVDENTEVGKAMASNPRTAIGQISELHYVFVVSDGRTEQSEGLSLYQLASFLQRLGVETAYNLDGGGSSTMVLLGEVINKPTTGGSRTKERSVSDIVYVGTT
ncbi:MAG: phosphodiester glycosidase family protein [Oscillospiraceae bacterium]|nr:phosphodiester glycosidase family protein [Oscillospiraceae bacterium]